MTLFAVACAAMFPLIHTGRPWLAAYWLLPYPNTMGIWPQFRSPLIWDVFAVSTYATVSLLFWYIGLIPDLATLRDRAKNTRSRSASTACSRSAGAARRATGSATRRRTCCSPGMSTPLVLSVHTVVSFDFAVGIIPGWHATIFPPYFVAGAIYAGFAMVLTLAIPLRAIYGLEDFITMRHLENMAQGHARDRADRRLRLRDGGVLRLVQRATVRAVHDLQPHDRARTRWSYWMLIFCNGIVAAARSGSSGCAPTPIWLFIMALIVNVGMWLERFVIIVTSPAPRLPALVVGHVLPDDLGLLDVLRHDRPVRHADVPVRPRAADDLDLRDADAGAGGEGEGRGRRTERHAHASQTTSRLYGLMAEFDDADVARRGGASGRYAEGYRKIDAFSPFPIHELFEALGVRRPPRAAVRAAAAASSACSPASGCATGCRRSPIR